jgi:hypothetical protein
VRFRPRLSAPTVTSTRRGARRDRSRHRVDRRLDRAARRHGDHPPKLHGKPIDRVACALLDMQQPSRSRFLRLVGPPATGTSQSGRAIAYRLWTQRGRAVETRRGGPFYGFAEMSGGPSSDDFHAPLPEPAAKSPTIHAAARSGRRASRGSRA